MFSVIVLWAAELAAFLIAFWPWHLSSHQVLAHVAIALITSLSVLLATCAGVSLIGRWSHTWVLKCILLGSYFAAVCSFHLLVIGALSSWGQLPTFEMVAAYARELRFLEQSTGVSPTVFKLLLAISWILSIAAHAVLLRKFNSGAITRFSKNAVRYSSPRVPALSMILVFVALPAFLTAYVTSIAPASLSEPLYVAVNGDVWKKSQTNPTTALRTQQAQKLDDDARSAYVPGKTGTRRNIVLITVDALRPDRMSLYGHTRPTTPNLDILAQRGQLSFSPEARAPCAESFCGLLSLLTGKHGHKLAARDFGVVEVLALYGYRRYAALSGDHSSFYGLRERYGPFDEYFDGSMAPDNMSLNDDIAVLAKVQALPSSDAQPTLFYFHLMSAHGLGRKHAEFQRWLPAKSVYNLKVQKSDEALLAEVQNGYDNGVLQADAIIAKILTSLREKRYLDDAIIFITGDHGDFLGEKGMFSHSRTLLEPVLRVPWIWSGEGVSKLPLAQPVVHADFAPTLLTMLGMPIPMHWDGRALQTAAPLAYSYHQQGEFAGLVNYRGGARSKFIIDRKNEHETVFDLIADHAEMLDVASFISAAQIADWRKALAQQQLVIPIPCDKGGKC